MSENCTLLADPIKSENDRRLYRNIELSNGLKVTLVSEYEPLDNSTGDQDESAAENEDKQSENNEKMAAAALAVKVGSYSDPEHVNGLAHFLEHMLFMGSEKYPGENEFAAMISKYGGYNNASTRREQTVYEISVTSKNFKEALDVFAQFFIAPLMNKDSVERELESVDSEFKLRIPQDIVRFFNLFYTFAKPGSPINKFDCGNLESLKTIPEANGIDVHSKVREFWECHYSSHLMALSIISRESLDTLQDWVVEIFGGVEKRDISEPNFEGHEEPFDTPDFRKLYKVAAIDQGSQLKITWAFPSLMSRYKEQPLGVLEWLIGQKGDGGLSLFLQKRLWALALGASSNYSSCLTTTFTIVAILTETGFEHIKDILLAIFQYLSFLKKVGPQKKYFDEIQSIAETNFRWKEEKEPLSLAIDLCVNMQTYETEDILRAEDILLNYDEDLIRECTEALRPDNCNIVIMSSNYEKGNPCDKTEKWLQVHYSQEDIPKEWIELFEDPSENDELALPNPNEFITTDFDLKSNDDDDTDFSVILYLPF